VEKGIRPLKFDEAVAIGEILGVPVTALYEASSENREIAAAVAQLNDAAEAINMRRRQIAELKEEIRHNEELIARRAAPA
jgi:ribosomal protein S2